MELSGEWIVIASSVLALLWAELQVPENLHVAQVPEGTVWALCRDSRKGRF